MNLAKVLKEYRWAVKVTQTTLAAEIGISIVSLKRFENGSRTVSGKNLRKILLWLLAD